MSNTMSYPCVICDEECLLDTIQCFQCEHWVHGECVPMTTDLLQKWSDANMKFLCEDCCFADGHFDHKKSLQRSWQHITFEKRPVAFVKIVGTSNTANEVFHCVHFECPADKTSINISNGGKLTLPQNASGSNSNASIQSQQTSNSENYVSAEYCPQDAPEADRMDVHSSGESES